MTSETCPQCGAEYLDTSVAGSFLYDLFSCGTHVEADASTGVPTGSIEVGKDCALRQLSAAKSTIAKLQKEAVAASLFGVWIGDGVDCAWIVQLPAGYAPTGCEELLREWKEGWSEAEAPPAKAVIAWYELKPIPGGPGPCGQGEWEPGYTEFEFVRYETLPDDTEAAAKAAQEAAQ